MPPSFTQWANSSPSWAAPPGPAPPAPCPPTLMGAPGGAAGPARGRRGRRGGAQGRDLDLCWGLWGCQGVWIYGHYMVNPMPLYLSFFLCKTGRSLLPQRSLWDVQSDDHLREAGAVQWARPCQWLLLQREKEVCFLSRQEKNCRELYFFKRFYWFIFRERGREGEREGEKHQCVVASYVPPTGDLGPQPRHVPWLGIELAILWFAGQRLIHWAMRARTRIVSKRASSPVNPNHWAREWIQRAMLRKANIWPLWGLLYISAFSVCFKFYMLSLITGNF